MNGSYSPSPTLSGITVHPRLVYAFGATGAVVLGYLLARQAQLRDDQFVQLTEGELLTATGLSRHEQRTAIARLQAADLLTSHRKAMFGQRNFRVIEPAIERMLQGSAASPSGNPLFPTSIPGPAKL